MGAWHASRKRWGIWIALGINMLNVRYVVTAYVLTTGRIVVQEPLAIRVWYAALDVILVGLAK